MYKVTCYDVGTDCVTEHMDSMWRYEHYVEAKAVMMECMMNTLNALVDVTHEEGLHGNSFTMHLNEEALCEKWGGVIRLHNILADIHDDPIALFDVVWVNEEAQDEYNKKLIDAYGDDVALRICSDYDEIEDEDGEWIEIEKYYFEGMHCPKSELYDTPEEAYRFALEFLQNMDLYADEL